MKQFSAAGCALAVLLVSLLAREAECTKFILGGTGVGWTNTANIDYNDWLSDYKVKIGDTLTFANYDTMDHSVVAVDKLGYNTCGASGQKLETVTSIASDISMSYTFAQSGPFYAICANPGHCLQGMKVFVDILNADGSENQTATAADTPQTNSASAMPGFSWTSQLLVATAATVSVVVAATTMFA